MESRDVQRAPRQAEAQLVARELWTDRRQEWHLDRLRWAEILDEGRYGDHGRFQVTRFVAGESLEKLDGPRPVEEVWKFLEDGARVLRAIHALGLIHYDVTPGNWISFAIN